MESGSPWRDTAWAMSEEMLAMLRRGYEAFSEGSKSAILEISREIATPDVEWGATGAFPGVEGMYRGPEAIQEWMEIILSAWEEFEVSMDEVLHEGDDVVVVTELLRGRGRESGVEVEMRVYSAYWFENGKLRRRAAFTERRDALEAAGLRE
jgi:ketosteroid isomerase-like protein